MAADDRDRLKLTFDEVAELYDRARPGYPAELFDDLGKYAGAGDVLEVGCGTGQATIDLARRFGSVLCVELGQNLAAVAKRNLREFPSVSVEVAPFEDWDARGRSFDLVFAATCWHWLDPSVRYTKAASLLRAGGRLAVVTGGHAFPKGFDPFFTDIQPAYDRIGESLDSWPLPPPDDVPDLRDEIEATNLFGDLVVRRYVWATEYTAEQYIDLLDTFSGNRAMPPWKRDVLYAEVRRLVRARPHPSIRKHHLAILHVATKRA